MEIRAADASCLDGDLDIGAAWRGDFAFFLSDVDVNSLHVRFIASLAYQTEILCAVQDERDSGCCHVGNGVEGKKARERRMNRRN